MYAILLGNIPIIFITFICGPRATRNGIVGSPAREIPFNKLAFGPPKLLNFWGSDPRDEYTVLKGIYK